MWRDKGASKWTLLWTLACIVTSTILFAIAEQPGAKVCSAPEYHQFDFWVGDWDAFDVDTPSKVVARTRVDRILDGCVLREDYQGVDGHQGQSFTIYDASKKAWRQSWVTNRGESLVIEGEFRDGTLVLTGSDRVGGRDRIVRGTWKAVGNTVHESAVTSTDGGKSWHQWFDIVFRPHSPERAD